MKTVLMCKPDYFDVKYVINPWMEAQKVDQSRARAQWQALADAYRNEGVKVEVIEPQPNVPDMVFTTDQGIQQRDTILLSNFRYPERQPETQYYDAWFRKNGYRTERIAENFPFEGGECLKWNTYMLMGTGFRGDAESSVKVQEYIKREVVHLELIDPLFYHLDMCLFPLNDEVVFYYPAAFSSEAITRLKKIVPDLQEFSAAEARGFAANSVVVGKSVMMQKGNPSFAARVAGYGYSPIELDVSEFIKSGGGIHCLTFVLN